MKSIKIVICRYRENVEWSKQLPNVLIYNKGYELVGKNYNQFRLKNVGREGHSIYHYIVENYDSLDDYTVFCQGNPFDHSPNLIKNLKEYIENPDLNIDFEYLSEWIVECKLSGCTIHKIDMPFKKVFAHLFGQELCDIFNSEDTTFKFGAGAQFIVSRDKIRKQPKEFYMKIVKILEYDVNPIEGFVIERFHGIIFLPQKYILHEEREEATTNIPFSQDTTTMDS